MRLFVTLFAIAAIIIFFALAFKRGTENRRDIMEIEKNERLRTAGETGGDTLEKHSIGLGSFGSISNTAGKTMKYLGIIILFAGTIISFCFAQTETTDLLSMQFGFSFLLFFTCELITCAAGFLFISLGEIIKLLDDISKNLERL